MRYDPRGVSRSEREELMALRSKLDIQDFIRSAIETDGGHHKQWCLKILYMKFGGEWSEIEKHYKDQAVPP